MTDPDDHWDDPGPAREEPDCWGCNDNRAVPGRFRRRRPCPSCSPTRVDTLRARARALVRAVVPRRRPAGGWDTEPPF